MLQVMLVLLQPLYYLVAVGQLLQKQSHFVFQLTFLVLDFLQFALQCLHSLLQFEVLAEKGVHSPPGLGVLGVLELGGEGRAREEGGGVFLKE